MLHIDLASQPDTWCSCTPFPLQGINIINLKPDMLQAATNVHAYIIIIGYRLIAHLILHACMCRTSAGSSELGEFDIAVQTSIQPVPLGLLVYIQGLDQEYTWCKIVALRQVYVYYDVYVYKRSASMYILYMCVTFLYYIIVM